MGQLVIFISEIKILKINWEKSQSKINKYKPESKRSIHDQLYNNNYKIIINYMNE